MGNPKGADTMLQWDLTIPLEPFLLSSIFHLYFLFPKGVALGEEPLKFPYQNFQCGEKLDLRLYLTSKNISRHFRPKWIL